MGNLTGIIPFSEITERSMNLAREDSLNTRDKFKGLVNDGYARIIPRRDDFDSIIKDSSISCTAYYNTGTVAISAAGTSITGTGTTWVTGMTGRKIKINSNNNVYTFTYVSATTGTISPALSGDNDISGAGYNIFEDEYALVSDFSRFLKNGSFYVMQSGRPRPIIETASKQWNEEYTTTPSDNTERIRLRGFNSSRYRLLQINPPPQKAVALPYDYVKIITPMIEYSTGTILTLANAGTAVTGTGTDFDGNIDTDSYIYYFRIDDDGIGDSSKWYLIDSADSDTGITLASAYGGVAISDGTKAYTISMIPDLPNEFHDWLIYLALIKSSTDQNDPALKVWAAIADEIEVEIKALYKSRRSNYQFELEDDVRG